MASLLMPPPLDLRPKTDAKGWAKRLDGLATPHGSIRLSEGMVPTLDGYDDGAWWVQDAAASLPALMLGEVEGLTVIDCCAAPGGKTAQLCAAGAKVIALDQSAPRIKTLSENMARLGMTPEIVVADGMTWQPEELVDAVLVDAPCSATGTIRRRPDILSHREAPDLAMLNRLQQGLLDQAATWLKPGGVLIYATCSILKDEGEAIVKTLPPSLSPMAITASDAPGFTLTPSDDGFIRVMPDALQLDSTANIPQGNDGFFIAKFKKD